MASMRTLFLLKPLVLLLVFFRAVSSKEYDGRIKTVVILMMENRSFDHMLGWLKRLNPEIDGLTGAEYNLVNVSDPASKKVFVSDGAEFVDPDPGHSFQAVTEQVFGGTSDWHQLQFPPPMNGFAQQAESMYPGTGFPERIMSAFRPEAVPSLSQLAMEFSVFDKWYSAFPGSTQPNRLFLHSAASHGVLSNIIFDLIWGMPQKTIFDSLYENGIRFGIYFQSVPTTLFFQSLRKIQYMFNFHFFDQFKQDAKTGRLPPYTVIEPRYFDILGCPANDDHPSHDVAEGQKFIKEVYETLRHSPQWNETLFIITYDEHGGFHDHVPTPVHNVPNPDGLKSGRPYHFEFNRLGVRVPTIMVSPWINKQKVVHQPRGPAPHSHFEHSSIAATVKKMFKLKSPFLTERDAWAGTFEDIVMDRDEPRTDCPERIVVPSKSLRHSPTNEDGKLTEWQQEMVQMCATLVGDHERFDIVNMAKNMSVGEASKYTDRAVWRFLSAGRAAALAGKDKSKLVDAADLARVSDPWNSNVAQV